MWPQLPAGARPAQGHVRGRLRGRRRRRGRRPPDRRAEAGEGSESHGRSCHWRPSWFAALGPGAPTRAFGPMGPQSV
eukprot:5933883-Pyramimonas_sp.AAC.1